MTYYDAMGREITVRVIRGLKLIARDGSVYDASRATIDPNTSRVLGCVFKGYEDDSLLTTHLGKQRSG